MSNEKNIIGRCCTNKARYLIKFSGDPIEDYWIILCDEHINIEPYNKNIIESNELETQFDSKS